jgi:hypothetical protein
MSTPQWFAEFERQEAMREERLDIIRANARRRDADRLYPITMDQHGSARSLEEYLAWLRTELAAERGWSRRRDLTTRVAAIEDELRARSP